MKEDIRKTKRQRREAKKIKVHKIRLKKKSKDAFCSPGKDGDCKQRKNEAVGPNFSYLMQQMHTRPRERGDDHRVFIGVNGGDNSKRVFPFQATPSGNLKIVPNQVNVPIGPWVDRYSSNLRNVGLKADA